MQLDKTRIVIRERGYLDVLDLTLHMLREFAGPLAVAFAAGVVPFMALNAWLLVDYAGVEFELGSPAGFIFLMLVVVFFEAPLALAPITLYLGHAVFTQRPSAGQLVRAYLATLPQVLLLQGLFRIWYLRWPYLSQVILLERNPLRAKPPRQKSTRVRAAEFHAGEEADLLARGIFSLILGTMLFFAIWLSVYVVRGMLVGHVVRERIPSIFRILFIYEWDRPMFTLYFPVVLWIVLGFFTVARFLSYLDLRIRREGWEVELILRAEGTRLSRPSL